MSSDGALQSTAQAALGQQRDYRLICCASETEATSRLHEVNVHLLVADADGLADGRHNLVTEARVSHPHVARLLIGTAADRLAGVAPHGPGAGSVRCGELAERSGAYLYLTKPVPAEQLRIAAKRALEMRELARRHRVLSRELKISMDDAIFVDDTPLSVKGGWSQFEKLVYVSPRMATLSEEARRAAATDLPVLIQGETGTGKELLARAIHFNSGRLNAPLLVQNCGGMSDETLHSELFGHVRGAFTGAIADRLGLFRAADGGTVLLDEISDVSPRFQVSLLRFLQEREVKPLGSDRIQRADVRIVAASNRPLAQMVERGEFRRDLYYRLKGFELHIPPLRDRPEDIPALAQFFIEKYTGIVGRQVIGITKDALARLQGYHYPGNVRELETEIRRMVAIADQGGYLGVGQLSATFDRVRPAEPTPDFAADGGSLKDMVERLERVVVVATLQRNFWNQSRTAAELGLSRVGLANKIKRYNIQEA